MKLSGSKYDLMSALFILAGAVMFFLAIGQSHGSDNIQRTASTMSRVLDGRLDLLEEYMDRALASDPGEWLDIGEVPGDMVIYRYRADTLQSWVNEFPISNDDIRTQMYVPVLANPRAYLVSPLSEVGDTAEYVNMGYRWYLVKSVEEDDVRVFGGIEILRTRGARATANRVLHLKQGYEISELSEGSGVPVCVDGRPQFQLVRTSTSSPSERSSSLVWAALGLLICSGFAFLFGRRSIRRLHVTLAVLVAAMSLFYFWGRSMQGRFMVFSPLLYAGGEMLYSLGAVLIINLAVLLSSLCLYITRDEIARRLEKTSRPVAGLVAVGVAVIGILAYTSSVLASIVENSGITLELYKISEIDFFSLLVYGSIITMLVSIPLIVQTYRPLAQRVFGVKLDAFSRGSRLLYAVLVAVYLVAASSSLGFRKEQSTMEMLAGRLSFDRDILLELRLRSVESEIADDMIIPALSVFNNTASSIQSRIVEAYLSSVDRDYNVSVYVFNNENNTRAALDLYNSILRDAVPIAPRSRFMYVERDGERPYYVGLFMYMIEGSGISRVLVCLDAKEVSGSRGYAGIFGITPSGRVTLPDGTSYARYEGANLKSSHGSYPYPTRLQPELRERIYARQEKTMTIDGYTHFITVIADNEVVVLSRTQTTFMVYALTAVFLAIIMFVLCSLPCFRHGTFRQFMSSYYRSRILGVMMGSLLLTLVAMASVSVYYVNSRNEGNLYTMMSDKINSISAMMEAGVEGIHSTDELDMVQVHRLLTQVGGDTDSDVTLYTCDGRLMMSTTPIVFERQLLGERIDGKAYEQIVYSHKRYYIQREEAAGRDFYSMYAPVIGAGGNMLAIVSSPYNEENYDFEKDAVTHTMTIVALFVLFLAVALFMVSRIVDTMFRPLDEMSGKMSKMDLESPEYIDYDRNDEISSIVQSYNRMVKKLSDSSRRLADAERDKAWNEMARQVAHEIKNPLTPMMLLIQKMMRRKQKGDPSWADNFDQVSEQLIYHINVLASTANDFSTFAKLYTEKFTEIPLDAVLGQETAMFEGKENITFTYMGFEGAKVLGPRPQLTRVFVNLLVNAMQAIGDEPDGHVVVSVRNSVQDGYYDIVFEDDGPGVSDEDIPKLFTPKFTTKSGGSGLGLAMCRSVLDTCGATISYQRSFSLGGACFTICYPKPPAVEATSDGSISGQDSR